MHEPVLLKEFRADIECNDRTPGLERHELRAEVSAKRLFLENRLTQLKNVCRA
jgi:hypothetical protein